MMLKFYPVFLLVILYISLSVVESVRFGGSRTRINTGSKRYSSNTNNVRVTNVRQKVRVRYERPWGGSSRYTWNSYGSAGYIYGYYWYVRTPHYYNNRHKEPTICRNEFDNLMDNGTHFEWFICPTQNHSWNYDKCCGVPDRQVCCTSSEYYRHRGSSGGTLGGAIAGPIIGIAILGCCCFCCIKKHRKNRMTTTVNQTITNVIDGSRQPAYPTSVVPPPGQQYPTPQPPFAPQPQQPYPQPQQPYPPPQQPYPQPQQPYPPQPYPPQQPYPDQPYPPQQPYPPPQQPYPDQPYPPPQTGPQQPPYPNQQPPYPNQQPPYPNQQPLLQQQPPPYEEIAGKPSAPPI